jgi:hypothetical protein
MSVEKNAEKEGRTDYYYYAAIPNGPRHATLDVGSFACRGWRDNGDVPQTAVGQFNRCCSSNA